MKFDIHRHIFTAAALGLALGLLCFAPTAIAGGRYFDCDIPEVSFALVADPCHDGDLVLPPMLLGNDSSRVREQFELKLPANVCVRVVGIEAMSLKTAPTVQINGKTVLDPRGLEKPRLEMAEVLALDSGSYKLEAWLATAKPVGDLVLAVRAATAPSARQVAAARDLAAMERRACKELDAELAALPVKQVEVRLREIRRTGHVPGRMQVERNPYGLPALLAPVPAEVGWKPPQEPAGAAREWVRRHAVLLGVADHDVTLTVESVETGQQGDTRIRLGQKYRGLRVVPDDVTLVLDGFNNPRRVQGSFAPVSGVTTKPSISKTEAIAIAAGDSEQGTSGAIASLVLFDLSSLNLRPQVVLC